MPKFKVTIVRSEAKEKVFTVTADNEDDAIDQAHELACNHEWSRGEAEYVTEGVEEVE